MRFLITGASGFVGKHLCQYLAQKGDIVIAVSRNNNNLFLNHENIINCTCSLEDISQITHLLEKYLPDGIVHLAAKSSVAYSWEHPSLSFLNNAQIFLNVIEAQRICLPHAKFLSVGSSEQYGMLSPNQLPVEESTLCKPLSPYAVARVAQEQLALIYSQNFNMDVTCTRSFNHIGSGQGPKFVVPSFLTQAYQIKKGNKNFFECGDISIVRDFVDIRDVVRAYRFLLLNGKPGEIYNICTGIGTSLNEILNMIMDKLSMSNIDIRLSNCLIRPADNKIIVGDNKKLVDLGFVFKYNINDSLDNIIEKDIRWKYL